MTTPQRILVTGGVRSGKSAYAEQLLVDEPSVTYLAPGPVPGPDDADWAARVAAHQRRRPQHWHTLETSDVAGAVSAAQDSVLLDCLGTWVTATLDELNAWDAPQSSWMNDITDRIDKLAQAWSTATNRLVAVTNEVGMGVHPEYRSGRVFRDVLGMANQRLASVSDDVVLLIAGRSLHL